MGGDDWRAVVRVIRSWGYVPVHAEVLAENGVVRLAWFATLPAKGQGMKRRRMKITYNVSDIFRKSKTKNCQHALEGILMVVDPMHVFNLQYSIGASTHTRQIGRVCLGNANIRGLATVRAMMQVARDA